MLTAKGEVMDKVLGLDNGADEDVYKRQVQMLWIVYLMPLII